MVHNISHANVYKFILLFPLATIFLAMLLVCGRCHLYLRMDVFVCWIISQIIMVILENQKSYNNIQSSRILSAECVRSLEFDDITFDNVVDAFQKYFAAHIDKDMFCDILAGERVPPFKKMCQIPDHKVFYVLFMYLHTYPAAKFLSN